MLSLVVMAVAAAASQAVGDIVVTPSGLTVDHDAMQAAIDMGLSTGRKVVFDATTKPFQLDRALIVLPASNLVIATLELSCYNRPGGWPTIEYYGTDAAFQTFGLKSSLIDSLRIRLNAAGASGFLVSTKLQAQSTSTNIFRQCAVVARALSPAGWLIGPIGAGPADVSCITFDRCSALGVSSMPLLQQGFWVFGGNTQDLTFTGCNVAGTVGYAWRIEGYPPYCDFTNASGSQLIGCDVSHVAGLLRAVGGSLLTIIGGRSEATTDFDIWTLAGGGPGEVTVMGHKFATGVKPSRVDGQTVIRFP